MKRNIISYMRTISVGLLFVLAILTGCATSEKTPLETSTSTLPAFSRSIQQEGLRAVDENDQQVDQALNKTQLEGRAKKEPTEQEVTITPEAFYYLLSGEIAGQRSDYNLSADSYIRAARLTNSPRVAARAAQIAMYAKDYKVAMDAATVWANSDPDNIAARKLVAGLQLREGDTEKAIDNYTRVLSSPGVDFEKTVLQIAESIVSNTSKPYPVIESLIERFPGTAELPFAYAYIALRQNDVATAERNLEKALSLRPDWDAALLMKTKLVAQSGDTATALAMLEKATLQFPDNAEIHTLYAKMLAMQHDYPKAVKHFQRVVELDPGNADAGFALAIMQSALGDFDSARDGLLELAKNPRYRQRAYLQLGQLSAENQLYDEALAWLDQVESGPLAYDAHIYASEILLKQHDLEGALSQLKRLRNQFPQLNARITLREAEIHSKNNQPEKAVEVLSAALEINPEDKQLLYMRSLLADQIGDYQMAESDLKALLKLEPDNVNALNALGYILCNRTDRLHDAEGYLQQAFKLKPNDPAILDSMGWLRYRQKNINDALKYLQSAYLQNNDVEIGAHLAEVLWVGNQHEQARHILQEIWKKDSAHDVLLKMKQRFPQAFIGIVD
ncbi:MAG TPA: tetratricopeptide repeat protein [Crenotrichaceae bacterium]|nr:tetratricopeptide repeat protein [Crenotrichaceae bacterium]